MYAFMYTNIYIYIYIYTHICIYVHISINKHVQWFAQISRPCPIFIFFQMASSYIQHVHTCANDRTHAKHTFTYT